MRKQHDLRFIFKFDISHTFLYDISLDQSNFFLSYKAKTRISKLFCDILQRRTIQIKISLNLHDERQFPFYCESRNKLSCNQNLRNMKIRLVVCCDMLIFKAFKREFILYFINSIMQTNRKSHLELPPIDILVKTLKDKGQLPYNHFKSLILQTSPLLKNQPNILNIRSPLFVVGDIHGQFYDLLNIFQTYGKPSGTKYLFLGDYVDRGVFSIEVISLLLAFKLKYTNNVFLLRGNHECRALTSTFNFKKQCLAKYDQVIYDLLMDIFDLLPISAVIDFKYFAVHGGISPICKTLRDIQQIDRFCEVPRIGGLCDLLWSDPVNYATDVWKANHLRQCSYFFGIDQSSFFLNRNSLKMIIRGHEVEQEGYKYQKCKNIPLTLTIFSAPNYGNVYKNKGCIACIKEEDLKLFTFGQVSQPLTLPNFQNVFEWTMPFIGQCVQHFSAHLLKMDEKKLPASLKKIMQIKQKFYQDLQMMEMVRILDKIMSAETNPVNLTVKEQSQQEIINNAAKFNDMKQSDKNQKLPESIVQNLVIGPKIHFSNSKKKLLDSQDQPSNDISQKDDISTKI